MILLLHPTNYLLLRSSLGQVGESLATLELGILNDTSIGVAGEVASPLNKGGSLKLAAGDWVETNGGEDAGVGQLGLRRDDRVGDVVVDGRVLLLLDLEHGVVLEGPLDDVGVGGGALAWC